LQNFSNRSAGVPGCGEVSFCDEGARVPPEVEPPDPLGELWPPLPDDGVPPVWEPEPVVLLGAVSVEVVSVSVVTTGVC
jgi:hypothetical protein